MFPKNVLDVWQDKGLITEEQNAQIADFQKDMSFWKITKKSLPNSFIFDFIIAIVILTVLWYENAKYAEIFNTNYMNENIVDLIIHALGILFAIYYIGIGIVALCFTKDMKKRQNYGEVNELNLGDCLNLFTLRLKAQKNGTRFSGFMGFYFTLFTLIFGTIGTAMFFENVGFALFFLGLAFFCCTDIDYVASGNGNNKEDNETCIFNGFNILLATALYSLLILLVIAISSCSIYTKQMFFMFLSLIALLATWYWLCQSDAYNNKEKIIPNVVLRCFIFILVLTTTIGVIFIDDKVSQKVHHLITNYKQYLNDYFIILNFIIFGTTVLRNLDYVEQIKKKLSVILFNKIITIDEMRQIIRYEQKYANKWLLCLFIILTISNIVLTLIEIL